jgi:hypothetical protein
MMKVESSCEIGAAMLAVTALLAQRERKGAPDSLCNHPAMCQI